MGVFNENAILGTSAAAAGGGYDIPYSCRFNSADSAYMHFTPSGSGNRRTFTVSFWFKIHVPQTGSSIKVAMSAGTNSKIAFYINTIYVDIGTDGSASTVQSSPVVYRDPSAWYHFVMKVDTTQAATADRVTIYRNGVEDTAYTVPAGLTLNEDTAFNEGSKAQKINSNNSTGSYMDAYYADWHMVDGLALDANSFGESGDYGEWKPKAYTGSHGTNGYHLDFKNAGAVYETGDRTSSITVTTNISLSGGTINNFVDGAINHTDADGFWWPGSQNPSGWYVQFDFLSSKVISAAKLYTYADGDTHGTWRWQGTDDTSGSWTNIGSTFTLQGAAAGSDSHGVGTELNGNTTAYRYYRLLGVSGSTVNNYMKEIEFKVGVHSANGLGTDASGGGNHFTPTNVSASDQMVDSPTNNFSTLNSVAKALNDTLSEGNLKKTGTSTQSRTCSTFGFDSGKWYAEYYVHTRGSDNPSLGIVDASTQNARNTIHVGHEAGTFGYYSTAAGAANVNHGGTGNNGGTYSTYTNGHIIGVALDIDNLKVYFYNNGSLAVTSGTTYETLTAGITYNFAMGTNGSGVMIANFGQDGTFAGNKTAQGNADDNGYGNFYYSPPSGFLAACSKNLTDSAVVPSKHFQTILYNNGAGAKTFTTHGSGAGFQPDLVWVKSRGSAYEHNLTDSERGVTKAISANATAYETTDSTGLTAFGADGFTVGADTNYADTTGDGMVAWCWKGGSDASGTTSGLGTGKAYTASYNADAGFSIVSYLGNGTAGHTIPHHLGIKPQLIFVKRRPAANDSWAVYNESIGATKYLNLEAIGAQQTGIYHWNNTEPTSSVFTLYNNGGSNENDTAYIAYLFGSIEGYSKIGSYVGNGNAADGAFIYTGFKPAWIMMKTIDISGGWQIHDSVRSSSGNPSSQLLSADTSDNDVSASTYYLDFLSNGFKQKTTWNKQNGSTNKYLYIAFSSVPFKNSNAV